MGSTGAETRGEKLREKRMTQLDPVNGKLALLIVGREMYQRLAERRQLDALKQPLAPLKVMLEV